MSNIESALLAAFRTHLEAVEGRAATIVFEETSEGRPAGAHHQERFRILDRSKRTVSMEGIVELQGSYMIDTFVPTTPNGYDRFELNRLDETMVQAFWPGTTITALGRNAIVYAATPAGPLPLDAKTHVKKSLTLLWRTDIARV